MEKKNWVIIVIILVLIVLVILFWNKLIIKNEEIIEADYCEYNFECVLAVNIKSCCSCPIPMNIRVIKLDGDYETYEEGINYWGEECSYKECQQCPSLGELICMNNKCKFQSEIVE